ncbi:unnamed protein product [Lactuca virosa]|uniref:Exocyst subunit Exo70 family protein n=1 Tax=Lactuca virosa TaxID=75947 RepID=A0AAU9M1Q8_9ASTR|nr:unnamed protein product [Lactuca virosa]
MMVFSLDRHLALQVLMWMHRWEADFSIPEWAKVLDPVRKLPPNVGSRIRNCVRESLKKNPPEWAKKLLEASISKDMYKGNASGPTKRAVINVLKKTFPEDVKEVWINLRRKFGLVDKMSRKFKLLYEKEVGTLFRRFYENNMNRKPVEEIGKELEEILTSTEIPEVPWETGIGNDNDAGSS